MVNNITVGRNNTSYILRTLHTSFNLKGINTCFNKVWNLFNQFKITWRKIIALTNSTRNLCCIKTAAGLSTHTTVGRLTTKEAGKEAETTFTYTQSSVNKNFKVCTGFTFDFFDFFKTKLTGKNHTLYTAALQKSNCIRAFYIHLGRSMKLKIRKEFLSHSHNGIVLHNKTIRPYFIQIREKTIKSLSFTFFADSIYSYIYLLLLFMKAFNGCLKLIPCKVTCSHSRIKTTQTKINSVRAFTNSGVERFNISRRS